MEISPNDFVGFFHRGCDPTGHLFHMELALAIAIQRKYVVGGASCSIVMESEPWRGLVSQLNFTTREVDRTSIQPAGCTGLEAAECETELPKVIA